MVISISGFQMNISIQKELKNKKNSNVIVPRWIMISLLLLNPKISAANFLKASNHKN